jgi:hypothetical protein
MEHNGLELEHEIQSIRRNVGSRTSRNIYRGANQKFIEYLHEKHPEVLNEPCGVDQQGQFSKLIVKRQLENPIPSRQFLDLNY